MKTVEFEYKSFFIVVSGYVGRCIEDGFKYTRIVELEIFDKDENVVYLYDNKNGGIVRTIDKKLVDEIFDEVYEIDFED